MPRHIYLRPDKVPRPRSMDTAPTTYPHAGGLCIAYNIQPELDWVGVGLSVSPRKGSWQRKKLKAIAEARLQDSPLQLHFDGLGVEPRHVALAVRTLLLEEPKWKYVDDKVLRPGRFTQRWGAEVLGPDGSLLEVRFDFLHAPRGENRPRIYDVQILNLPGRKMQRPLSHWILRMPSWLKEMVL